MGINVQSITVKTHHRNEMINITEKVRNYVLDSEVKEGMIILFVPHTTAAITINENADPDVKIDMLRGLDNISPELHDYKHFEGNSDAHIKSSLIGVDQTIIIASGQLVLGSWQGIYFCEFDGPRTRTLKLKIISE